MRVCVVLCAAAAAVWVGSAAIVEPASACINGVVVEKDEAVRLVARARKAMEKRKYRRVLRLLTADHFFVPPRVERQIYTLRAVAKLRLGKTRPAERYFRARLKRDQDNPYFRARLAEALSARKGMDAVEAWRILDDLERRDLMPDAEAWATLARLRERANDRDGYRRAVERCRATARDAGTCPGADAVASTS